MYIKVEYVEPMLLREPSATTNNYHLIRSPLLHIDKNKFIVDIWGHRLQYVNWLGITCDINLSGVQIKISHIINGAPKVRYVDVGVINLLIDKHGFLFRTNNFAMVRDATLCIEPIETPLNYAIATEAPKDFSFELCSCFGSYRKKEKIRPAPLIDFNDPLAQQLAFNPL